MIRKILLFLLAVLVVLQIFRPKLDNRSQGPSANNINNFAAVPSDVDQMLKTSCYDCHSNNTQYPWYASIQPVGWWLRDHINEGKKELNFDEFGSYALRRQYHKLEELGDEVEHEEMPLSSYTLIHTNAKLSAEQRRMLVNWSEQAMNDMKAKYPVDSLIRKK